MAAFLLMESLMLGVFAAQDLFLFYIFFEGGLIPMYLIIGIWGGAERIKASYKFFLYTFFGSVLMLIAMIYMIATTGTTSIPTLMAFRDGILVFNQPGALSEPQLEQVIEAVKGLDMDEVREKVAAQEAEQAGTTA